MRTPFGCGWARRAMPLEYYAALTAEEGDSLRRHLSSCAACASRWETMRRALDAADPETVFPMEAEVDWSRHARATVARARAAEAAGAAAGPLADPLSGEPGRPFTTLVPAAARWVALAAAALVAVLLVYGWRGEREAERAGSRKATGDSATGVPATGDTATGDAPTAESVREAAAMIETRLARRGAARYLTDSRVLLLNLVQAQARCRRADGQYDIAFEKEKSGELLRRKTLHEGNLDTLRDRRLADLVGQLESLLIQVASLEDCASARQLHDLREQIEKRQILLRIDLLTREMQEKTRVV